MSLRRWWPRPTQGLPPGQRLLLEMPRFSDRPQVRPPTVPQSPELELLVAGHPPISIAVGDLITHPAADECTHDFHCVTGWSVKGLRWRGVPLATLIADTSQGARVPAFGIARGHDEVYATFLADDLLDPLTMVATHLNGELLDPRHGAPLRLVTPNLYGYKNVKHLCGIELVDDPPASGFGPKEHPRGRVALEERHATLPNWLIRLPYRLAIPITAHVSERTLGSH